MSPLGSGELANASRVKPKLPRSLRSTLLYIQGFLCDQRIDIDGECTPSVAHYDSTASPYYSRAGSPVMRRSEAHDTRWKRLQPEAYDLLNGEPIRPTHEKPSARLNTVGYVAQTTFATFLNGQTYPHERSWQRKSGTSRVASITPHTMSNSTLRLRGQRCETQTQGCLPGVGVLGEKVQRALRNRTGSYSPFRGSFCGESNTLSIYGGSLWSVHNLHLLYCMTDLCPTIQMLRLSFRNWTSCCRTTRILRQRSRRYGRKG